jgi:hypothetical protein
MFRNISGVDPGEARPDERSGTRVRVHDGFDRRELRSSGCARFAAHTSLMTDRSPLLRRFFDGRDASGASGRFEFHKSLVIQ